MSRVRVKICCISSLAEARLAVACGVDALGLVSAMPSGPGVIAEGMITEIAAWAPPPVATFLLTSATTASAIIAQARRCRPSVLQLVDEVEPGTYAAIREALPGVRIVQVIHVVGPQSVTEARALAAEVDALLLDSGNPALAVKELGGTGRVHDWSLSRRIVEAVDRPVFLAGGLNAGNVTEAIRAARPFGVDICSGVRSAGRLDEVKLRAFLEAVGAADQAP